MSLPSPCRSPGPRKRKRKALDRQRDTAAERFDAAFPLCGPCMFCGSFDTDDGKQGFHDARHRLLDAIRSRHRAGDSIACLARDYSRTGAEIRLALAWGGL